MNVKLYEPWVSNPGEWNEPSLAATVCGSSSWLVHVTDAPAGTVSWAGLNLKSLIVTAVPPCGVGDSAVVADAETAGMFMPGMAWPDMPGVTPGRKVIEGAVVAVSDAWLEQPAVSRRPAAASRNMAFTLYL